MHLLYWSCMIMLSVHTLPYNQIVPIVYYKEDKKIGLFHITLHKIKIQPPHLSHQKMTLLYQKNNYNFFWYPAYVKLQ
jgi:hypothetical protein